MKKKIVITVVAALVFIFLAAYLVIGNPVVASHNNQLKKSVTSIGEVETVTLNEVVPFEWDTVYTFSPYTPKEEIEKVIGFKSNSIKETVSEDMIQLVFVKDKKVTANICGYAENLGYDISFTDSVLFKDNKVFSVETTVGKTTDIVKLVLQ